MSPHCMSSLRWHIGCSGFSYKEWRGEFYPKGLAQKDWLDYYAERFNTLELNVTFYRFPSLALLQNFYKKVPDGFLFSAKVPRMITHLKKFTDTHQTMQEFYALLQHGLGEKLGCVLFQLPPSTVYSEEALEKVISHTNPAFKNVIEFRHESWWREDVQETLAANNVSFCGVSFPKIAIDDAVINTPVCYYRFQGVPVLFHSGYDEAFIQKIYNQISGDETVKEAFVYFNNTASGAALENAKYLKRLVANGWNGCSHRLNTEKKL